MQEQQQMQEAKQLPEEMAELEAQAVALDHQANRVETQLEHLEPFH